MGPVPSNRITWIAEDHAGSIWFAGDFPARFDGVGSKVFFFTAGVPPTGLTSIFEDHAGNVWGTMWHSGVIRYDGQSWKNFTVQDGLVDSVVYFGAEGRAGLLWFATGHGLDSFDGTTWTHYLPGENLNTLLVDHVGNLWVGSTGDGVFRYDGTTWTHFTNASTAGGLGDDYAYGITEDHDGGIWIATDHSGVDRLKDGSWRSFTVADGLLDDIPWCVAADREGNVWVGSNTGLNRYDGSTWRTWTTGDGLVAAPVTCVREDAAGALWLAAGFSGMVNRFDQSSWKTFDASNGLGGKSVTAMLEDHDGSIWFSTEGGITRWQGTSRRTFTTADSLPAVRATTLAEDRDHNIWAGYGGPYATLTDGLYRFDGTSWTHLPLGGGLPPESSALKIIRDHLGNLWFVSLDGIATYDGATWVGRTSEEFRSYWDVAEDRSGKLWFAGQDSLLSYDGATWARSAPPGGFPGGYADAVFGARNGDLWIISNGWGLTRFDGTTWTLYDWTNGLPSLALRGIVEGRDGSIWVGTDAGITRFDGVTWTTFTTDQGLASLDSWALLEDRTGSLWFGSPLGVSRYERDRVPPVTRFVATPPRVSPSQDQSASFVAAFNEVTDLAFSHRLDGGSWSSWSRFATWSQTGLADGLHILEARSRDFEGNVDPHPAVANFEVDATPPAPVIAAPAFGTPVRGAVEIRGMAADARFKSYRVEARPSGAATWNPPDAMTLAVSSSSVASGPLATWDTSALPDGNYEVRLAVSDTLGLMGTTQVSVIVDNHSPLADVTAPARVSSATGGDIFTTNGELHFYFPPHAFDQDAVVTIGSATAPDTLPSGAVRVQPGYAIAWGVAALKKRATLEFSSAGRSVAPGSLAIYESGDGSSWRRLGGTSEGGKVSLVVQEAGRYALYAETTVAQGGAVLSELSFTPRAFSPRGGFANAQVGIGFTLGRSATVTVRVYNRAGRLMREVVAGETLPPGANLVRWDGRDRDGGVVEDGLYVVTVEALGLTRRNALAVVR
jgi:ligand-binding sensor domain-containing protein